MKCFSVYYSGFSPDGGTVALRRYTASSAPLYSFSMLAAIKRVFVDCRGLFIKEAPARWRWRASVRPPVDARSPRLTVMSVCRSTKNFWGEPCYLISFTSVSLSNSTQTKQFSFLIARRSICLSVFAYVLCQCPIGGCNTLYSTSDHIQMMLNLFKKS